MLHGQACAELEERLTRPIDEFIQNGSPGWVSDGAIHVHETSLTQVFTCMSGLLLLACTDLASFLHGRARFGARRSGAHFVFGLSMSDCGILCRKLDCRGSDSATCPSDWLPASVRRCAPSRSPSQARLRWPKNPVNLGPTSVLESPVPFLEALASRTARTPATPTSTTGRTCSRRGTLSARRSRTSPPAIASHRACAPIWSSRWAGRTSTVATRTMTGRAPSSRLRRSSADGNCWLSASTICRHGAWEGHCGSSRTWAEAPEPPATVWTTSSRSFPNPKTRTEAFGGGPLRTRRRAPGDRRSHQRDERRFPDAHTAGDPAGRALTRSRSPATPLEFDWCLRQGQRPDPGRTVKRPPGSRYRDAYGRAIQYMQPGPAPSPIGISRVTSSVFKSTTATRSAALSPR